jgi:hypothetical protein
MTTKQQLKSKSREWLEEKVEEQADIIRNQAESIDEQEQEIEEQELEILELKAKVSELQERLRAEEIRVKRLDFPTETVLGGMSKTELEALRKDTYDAWLWGSNTVDHEELSWRVGAIVKAMNRGF